MFTKTKKYKQAVASRHCYHEMRNEMKKNEILRKTTILVRKNKKTALTTSQLKNFTPHTIFHFTAA